MKLVIIAALIAACEAAKLDRTYLPPASSQSAGGELGSLQTPFINSRMKGLNLGTFQTPFGRTNDNNPSQGSKLPLGSYENEHQGVVVEAAAPGTRASNQPSGLGGPRENYGSMDSKVGEAAFRGTKNQARPSTQNVGFQDQQFVSNQPQGPESINNQDYPDLSAFYQPSGQINTGYKPGSQLLTDKVSDTVKYHMNIGLNKFNYGYETENGIKVEENGVSNDGVTMQGGYSYTGDDGKTYSVVYTADKDGYRPMGSHLPTPPPIPAEILESLQQNAKDEANGIRDDGSYDAQKYNTEDDYTQSDTNGNYNDRQSNRFGERPGSDAGASGFINQHQQGYVRPNAQGQYSAYDFPKDPSSTQSGTFNFGTGVSGFNNKGQSNFEKRPGNNNVANAFLNEDQQGFVRPNVQKPLNAFDFSQANLGNNLIQNGQTTQFGNRFGSQFQYLPPTGSFSGNVNAFTQIDSSKFGFQNNVNTAQLQFEQSFKDQGSFSKPIPTITTSNSYGAPSIQGSLHNNPSSTIHNSNFFGTNDKKVISQNNGAFVPTQLQSSTSTGVNTQNSPTMSPDSFLGIINNRPQGQGSLATSFSNVGITSQNNIQNPQRDGANAQIGAQSSLTGSNLGLGISGNAPNASLSFSDPNQETPIPNFGFTTQSNVNDSPQGIFSQADSQGPDDSKLSLNNQISSVFSTQTLPTKKPELILTTPLDNHDQQSNIAVLGLDTSSVQLLNENSNYFGAARPVSNQFSNAFSEQTQALENSYIYNKPSKPFNTPNTQINSNKSPPGTISGSINSVMQSSGSSFSKLPIGSTISTQNQGGIKYPQSITLDLIRPTSSNKEETDKNTNQAIGITQASISSFPTISPTLQTNLGELYEYTKPDQGLLASPQQQSSRESNSEINQQTYVSENEDNNKLQVSEESNTQLGQRFPTPSTSLFGLQTTPSRLNMETNLAFGQKPTQQQLGYQPSFSFGQPTEPSHFSTQFGQKQTLSPVTGPTSTSLNQQTIPMRFGIQTNSPFGQSPTQSQLSLGQQTKPSSFGIETSKLTSISQATPSRFGALTSSLFRQKPTLASFGAISNNQPTTNFGSQTNSALGQQTTPSRFGIQTSTSFGQKPIRPQLGGQTSISFGSLTTPSRFGAQTASSFGQQTISSTFGIQPSPSSGLQTTPTFFDTQTSSIFGKKTTPSQFTVQSGSSFGQTTPSRFGESENGQQTSTAQSGGNLSQEQSQSQESNKESKNQSNSKPTPAQPSKFTSLNSEESIKNTNSDEVYEYNKPSIGFSSKEVSKMQTNLGFQQSQNENKDIFGQQFGDQIPQFGAKPNNQVIVQTELTSSEKGGNQQTQVGAQFNQESNRQSDEQSFSSSSNFEKPRKPNQQTQTELFPRFPEQSKETNTRFGSPQQTNFQIVAPTSPSEQTFNNKEAISDFSLTDLINSTHSPSSLNSQDSFNKQKQEQSQTSQSSEVYQYNKPSQSLPDSSQKENNKFGHSAQQAQIPGQSIENTFDTSKPITSSLSQSDEKSDNDQITEVTSSNSNSQTSSSLSLGILPSSHPFPQLAFYSACCRSSKPQNTQGSQPSSTKFPSSSSFGNVGDNRFGDNKNNNQDTNESGLTGNRFGNQGFEVQKDTAVTGKEEEFGGPRQPPKFDETGYHY